MIRFREKTYTSLTKSDLIEIIVPRVISSAAGAILSRNIGKFFESVAIGTASDILTKIFKDKVSELKNKRLGNLTNQYLIESLNRLRYKESRDYTINNKRAPLSINLNNGILMISMNKGYNDNVVDLFKGVNSQITDMGKFTFISYMADSKNKLDMILDMLMKNAKKVNIYDNR